MKIILICLLLFFGCIHSRDSVSDFSFIGQKISWRAHNRTDESWWIIPDYIWEKEENIERLNSNPQKGNEIGIFTKTRYWILIYDDNPLATDWVVKGPFDIEKERR